MNSQEQQIARDIQAGMNATELYHEVMSGVV